MEKDQLSRRHRLTIDINLDLYNYIKADAYQHEQSLSEYISNILYQSLPQVASTIQHPRPLTPETLASIMAARQQILEDTHGQEFEDSTELIRQMRLERSEELDQL